VEASPKHPEPADEHVHLTITHRELRNNSGPILRRVEAGETLDITNHGKVVGRIGPALDETPLEESRRLGHTRPPTTPRSALRKIKRAKSGLTSEQLLADSRGRW
jgi:prevent-host-death family protein